MISPATVYVKSAKGQEEIDKKTYRLSLKLRSLLIMVNGQKSAGDLIAFGGPYGGGIDLLLAQLHEGGFIEPRNVAQSAPATAPSAKGEPVAAQAASASVPSSGGQVDKWLFEKARGEISRLVFDTLGPDGDMLALRVEKTGTLAELKPLVEKIREIVGSIRGKQKADALASKINDLVVALERQA